jgi:hypothetical protein
MDAKRFGTPAVMQQNFAKENTMDFRHVAPHEEASLIWCF